MNLSCYFMAGGVLLSNGFAGIYPRHAGGGRYMTPKEIIEHINQLLDNASARQLELILRIVQAILK